MPYSITGSNKFSIVISDYVQHNDHHYTQCKWVKIETWSFVVLFPGIILFMYPANERWCYTITQSSIGWAPTQDDPWFLSQRLWHVMNRLPYSFAIRELYNKICIYMQLKYGLITAFRIWQPMSRGNRLAKCVNTLSPVAPFTNMV